MTTFAKFIWTHPERVTEVVDKAVQYVALQVQSSAKRKAPVDTGTLQASITAARIQATADEVEWQVGTNVHYAAFQEFGTSRIPPHPYLGPALEEMRARYGG